MPPVLRQGRAYLQGTGLTVKLPDSKYNRGNSLFPGEHFVDHLSSSPSTFTRTNTAFSPAELDRCSEYLPESSLVLSGITRKDMVSTWSTCPRRITLSTPRRFQVTLGAGLPLITAKSRMGHPALTDRPFLRLASRSISGASVAKRQRDKETKRHGVGGHVQGLLHPITAHETRSEVKLAFLQSYPGSLWGRQLLSGRHGVPSPPGSGRTL